MDSQQLGFGARLWLAIVLPWKVLFNAAFAWRVQALVHGRPELEAPPPPPPPPPPAPSAPDPTAAMVLLSILQREGRFIDFLQEDVSGFSDADIGAAARVVHEGCKRGLAEYVHVGAVRAEAEGDPVVLDRGFDPTRNRVTGNVVGEPPFRGRLAHHGWQVVDIRLPALAQGHDPKVVAPAEVEL